MPFRTTGSVPTEDSSTDALAAPHPPGAGVPFFLAALAAGLAFSAFFPWSPALLLAPPLFTLLWFPLRFSRGAPLVAAAFFATLGFSLAHLQSAPPQRDHVTTFISEEIVTVEGRVLSLSSRPGGAWSVDLASDKVIRNGSAATVRGAVRLSIKGGDPRFSPGDRLRFRARLRQPRLFGTPGEFDFPRHLAARGIHVTAFVADARDLAAFPSEPEGRFALERWRRAIAKTIDAAVDSEAAPLVRALVIGDKSGITPEQRRILSRGGVSHLFSISGLHLGLVALFFFAAARHVYVRCEALLLLAPPSRALPPLLLPPLFVYLLLTGSALPTLRAFLAAAGTALLFLFGRHTPPLKILSAIAFVVLLAHPLALFEPSFQLSFAGVLGIIVLVPRWSRHLARLPALALRPAQLMLTTLAATLTTTPLVLLHFHLVAPAGLLTNLAAVPLIGFLAVPSGLAGALLSPWFDQGALFLFCACAWILQTVLAGVEIAVGLPWLEGWRYHPSLLQVTGASALVAALLLPPGRGRRLALRRAVAAAGLIAALSPLPAPSGLSVTALSVGQGDATLLSRPGGKHYLIDGGGLYGSDFDTGERLVAPALGRLGVRSLEAVVLTHDHPDHSKGLVYILKHFPVRAFWSGAPLSELNAELREAISSTALPTVIFDPGWNLLEGGENALAVYVPQENHQLNDTSLVLYARNREEGVLLTGDLESAGVRELLGADGPPGPVTLLKLPHHGSRRSTPHLLLDRFEPGAGFASAGYANVYRLPHEDVVQEMQNRGIPLYRSDLDGTVRFCAGQEGWRARRWERGIFR